MYRIGVLRWRMIFFYQYAYFIRTISFIGYFVRLCIVLGLIKERILYCTTFVFFSRWGWYITLSDNEALHNLNLIEGDLICYLLCRLQMCIKIIIIITVVVSFFHNTITISNSQFVMIPYLVLSAYSSLRWSFHL